MRATRSGTSRGFVLAYVLVVAAVLSLLCVMLLQSADQAAAGTREMELKNNCFNAAEAGLDSAIDALDISLLTGGTRSATLADGYQYKYTIYPNFVGALSLSILDPLTGNGNVSIPVLGALIVSVGSGPNGERPSTVEAVVSVDVTQLKYPQMALVGGLDIQGTYSPSAGITSAYGINNATVHANGNITAQINGGIQGRAEASGETNTLPPGTTGATTAALPTVSQFDYMVASYKNQATALGLSSTTYVPGGSTLQPAYNCTAIFGCVLFYDGSLGVAQTAMTGPWTMVVNGDLTLNDRSSLIFSARPSQLIVNGNVSLGENAVITAFLEAKGSTSLGSGVTFTGAIMTLGTVTFDDDGSSGAFSYDPSVIPPSRSLLGLVKIVTYAEY